MCLACLSAHTPQKQLLSMYNGLYFCRYCVCLRKAEQQCANYLLRFWQRQHSRQYGEAAARSCQYDPIIFREHLEVSVICYISLRLLLVFTRHSPSSSSVSVHGDITGYQEPRSSLLCPASRGRSAARPPGPAESLRRLSCRLLSPSSSTSEVRTAHERLSARVVALSPGAVLAVLRRLRDLRDGAPRAAQQPQRRSRSARPRSRNSRRAPRRGPPLAEAGVGPASGFRELRGGNRKCSRRAPEALLPVATAAAAQAPWRCGCGSRAGARAPAPSTSRCPCAGFASPPPTSSAPTAT